jgi:hypothetical protein
MVYISIIISLCRRVLFVLEAIKAPMFSVIAVSELLILGEKLDRGALGVGNDRFVPEVSCLCLL